jgi:5'-3' exonuclease
MPASGSGFTVMIRAARLRLLQGGEHARVVRARVLPGDDDQVRLVEVLQEDAALADADGLVQRGTRRLVAHVGAVRQVVRAELAGEQLVQERRLVAGAPRGVEQRLVGGGEGGELLGDDVEGALPGHRLVVVGALREVHGLGETALLAQPVAAAGREVGDRVRGEEVRGHAAQGGLLGDRLRAVLAELRRVPVLRLGPGAAGAVEAVLLIDPQQRQRRALHTHLLLGHAQAVPDRGQSGGGVLRRGDLRCVLNRITLGRLAGHRGLLFEHTCEVRLRSSHAALTTIVAPSGAMIARGVKGVTATPRRRSWRAGRVRLSVGRGRIGGVADSASKKTEKTSGGGRPLLMLMDGHSLAYRAFFALPAENFTTATGQPTNAIYGFASMLANTLRDEAPTHFAVAFDVSRKTWRSEEFTEYKANRSKTPDEFKGQVELIGELLDAMHAERFAVDGFEADDIIATLATQAEAAGFEVLIVTGDRDSFQLVSEHTTVLYPTKGVSELTRFTPEKVFEKYGLTPAQYPDFAALRGDPSDNLPGIPGVGEKTAAKWINQFGSFAELVERAEEVKGKAGQNLRDHLDAVKLNRRLTEMVRDVELPKSARRPGARSVRPDGRRDGPGHPGDP